MQSNINHHNCISKNATVLKCAGSIATLRMHTNGEGCEACSKNCHNTCMLYTFGSIFSRHSNIRRVYSKHLLEPGERVQLIIASRALLKIAAGCYGLPIVMLMSSAASTHLLLGTEWLTVSAGLIGLVSSYPMVKQWLRVMNLPDIQLVR